MIVMYLEGDSQEDHAIEDEINKSINRLFVIILISETVSDTLLGDWKCDAGLQRCADCDRA